MKDVIFVTKLEAIKRIKVFVDLNKVVAVELPQDDTFKIYFTNTVWVLPTEEFEYVMKYWKNDYKVMRQYQDYINS